MAAGPVVGDDHAELEALRRDLQALRDRVAALEDANRSLRRELEVERLVVRKELIVSDTGVPWEDGFEEQQIPRGIYARSLWDGPGGLWVRSRLIKGELDDPFDDRFHALERDGTRRGTPGHVSWNAWIAGAWRQMAILQGEALEPSEWPPERWNGDSHPGRLRIQTFRPEHGEPLTDAVIGQGMMSLGGGGFGGDGLPYPRDVLELWGGKVRECEPETPPVPQVASDDGSGIRVYAVVAVGPQGRRSGASESVRAGGLAVLRWDRSPGADAYIVLRDGEEVAGPLRMEGARKEWRDPGDR